MRDFDLEEAKAGTRVCTRDGDKVEIIGIIERNFPHPILAKVYPYLCAGESLLEEYTMDGSLIDFEHPNPLDLMMED